MNIQEEKIAIRLKKLREYYKILKGLQKVSLNDFQNDPVLRGALERYLQLASEASIDIGEMIISAKGWDNPLFYSDVFVILEKEKVISKRLSKNFVAIAKFRNILVHDYVEINLNKMYNYLQNDLDDFKKFILAIAKFLKKDLKI